MRPFRRLDTAARHGRMNVALDQALIDSHRAGHSPDTLRFLEFSPSVLVGRHQDLSRELDLAFCRAHAIDVGRRVTGGGAIYLDHGQIGWEFVCRRASLGGGDLATLTARVCSAAADGLARLGVDVRFRPRNDLEIDGRKVGGTGGFFDGATVFYQGTVLIDAVPGMMFGALRVGADKRARHAAEPAARVTTLSEALGGQAPDKVAVKDALAAGFAAAFGVEFTDGGLSAAEEALAERLYDEEIGCAEFVHDIDDPTAGRSWRSATRDTPGGLVTVHLGLAAGRPPRIERVLISGDFFITPPRLLFDLEQCLVQVAVADVAACVAAFMARSRPEMLSVTPADLTAVIEAAAGA